jgi:rare lipoprotein A
VLVSLPRAGLLGSLVLLLLAGARGTSRRRRPAEEGEASWYGPGLYGRKTASGEVLRPGTLTAAHRTLPFGTCLRVINLENGRAVQVRCERSGALMPPGASLDVSETAAHALGMHGRGVTRVRLERCPGSAEGELPPLEAGPGAAQARALVQETAEGF